MSTHDSAAPRAPSSRLRGLGQRALLNDASLKNRFSKFNEEIEKMVDDGEIREVKWVTVPKAEDAPRFRECHNCRDEL